MASKKIGLVLALDKDKEFRDALKACKDEVKSYKDSIKELDDKFKANEGTMDDLKKKNEELTNKQEAYRKQLDAAKTGLEQANATYQKQANHLRELRDRLKEAEEAQQKMKDEGLEGTEAYQKQCEEVDKLRDAVAKQAANVATAEQKVNSWTREVKNAEKGLEDCNADLDQNAKDMDELGKQADDAGKDMEEFAEDTKEAAEQSGKLSISIGDMVKNKVIDLAGDALRTLGEKAVEAAKYVVEVGSSFEAQMSKVGAISGATGSDMEKLTNKAKEMGATTKFSATESGEALEYMAMAGWKTNDMVNGLEGIMNLAAASGENLGTTSDIVTDALTAFGKSAEDSGRLADIMAAASSNANTNVGMMGETFKYAAPVAGALGYTMEDTSIAIGLMANAGIKASQAGTSIRAGLTNLVKPAKQAAQAMAEYKISVTDDDGRMLTFRELMVQLREKLGGLDSASQAAAAAAIFGKNAMSGWLAIINGSDADFEKLTAAVDGSNGAAQRMADTMQDNLSGKMVILQSALEGLGIAAYDYIKGPLSAVVEGVTRIISGITDILQPQKTALESFIDDIKAVNEQVDKSIGHAQETVSQGTAKAAEIEAYKGILDEVMTKCEQFNYVDLGNGKYQILDATGAVVEEGFQEVDSAAGKTEDILEAWASGGLNTTGIDASSKEAQNMIGYVSDKADTVESRLNKFASQGIDMSGVEKGKEALIQIFDDMGNEVESFQTDISKAGDVEIDTRGVSEGTTVMITCLDNVLEGVETFKTDISNIGDGKIDLSRITSEFEKVEDSVRQTYVITDEFTKSKISAMVDALGGSVEGLAEAWNAQTGELTASHEELLKWFDTAKEVAMYEALENAMHELYDAWGEAAVNCAKSSSALKTALDDYNEAAGTTFQTFEDFDAHADMTNAAWDELYLAVVDAKDAHDATKETLKETETELDNTAAALGPYKESLDAAKQSTEEAGVSADQAAQNLANLEEAEEGATVATSKLTEEQQYAIDKYQALFGVTDEYLEKQNELTATDLAEWCEEGVTKYLDKIGDEYDKLAQNAAGAMSSFVTSMKTTTEEGEISLQSMVDSLIEKQEKLKNWADNMEKLGQMAGNGFSQALYDELLKEGPEKGYEKVEAIVQAMEAGTPEFEALSREYDNALSLAASSSTLASYTTTGKEYESALSAGFEGSLIEYYDMVENGVNEAAETASSAAENFSEAGEKSGTKTKEGIDSTSAEVTAAAEGMIDSAKDASDKLTTNFYVTGQQIPQELRRGVNIAKTWSDKATEDLVKSMHDILKENVSGFNMDGQDLISGLNSGMQSQTWDVQQTVRDMMQDAKQIVNDTIYEFRDAGSSAVMGYADGISSGSYNVSESARTVAWEAKEAVSGTSYDYYDIGYNMMVGLGNGISAGTPYITAMANNAAVAALNTARSVLGIASPSKEFKKLGGFSMQGLGIGFKDGTGMVVDSVEKAMTDVKESASKKLTGMNVGDIVGSVSLSSDNMFAGLTNGFAGAGAGIVEGLHEIGAAGRDELDALTEATNALMVSMDSTATGAGMFFDQLARGAEQALQSALAMQALQNSMNAAQNGVIDMAAVISGLLDQMTSLSQAVSGMDLNPSVSVQIGNKAIDNYITKASVRGMAQAQRNVMMAQGR